MREKKIIVFLLMIMAAISLTTGGTAIGLLYRTAFEEQKNRLVDMARSQARLIEAVARFNLLHTQNYHGTPRDATLSQIRDAHLNFPGFGRTGEFTLAELQGDLIIFLLSHRHFDLDIPKPVPMSSQLAEPMRRALLGISGTVIGLDYRGEKVLAAHEFVKVLGIGIVVKRDLDEIQMPFIKTGLLILTISFFFIALGAVLFLKLSEPIIRQLSILARFPNENPNPVIRVSEDCTVLYSNRSGERLLEHIKPENGGDRETLRLPELIKIEIIKAIKKGTPSDFQFSSGNRVYNFLVSPIADINNAYLYGVDITEQIALMDELKLNTAVFMNTMEGVMICDKNGAIKSVNPAFVDITGYQPESAIGENPRLLKSGKHDQNFYEKMWSAIIKKGEWKGEIWNRRSNGEIYPQETTINTITNNIGVVSWYASIFRDITERKTAENSLIRLSSTDGLTGIANRRIFDETIEKEWNRALRSKDPFAIVMIDIDHFKLYNDNYGHQQGDICLKEVAKTLQRCISRSTDLLARYGGEEFVAILPMTDTEGARQFAETMRTAVEAMALPHQYSETAQHVTVSIGLGVVKPARGASPSEIIQLADKALYEAKHSGRNRVYVNYHYPKG